ncbi:hypothetical protein ACFFMR_25375 [Micromonospora andamanensis]|uniref:Uncharacterized protein n=1 Tax=Micromonospora andamanensis TaxID=1287068 RepID=A0ABQ4I014_9ACTN|nr:hypothetical protein [Micromonospora andamanensis]GIJ11219.1 hypothetical protein Van01_44330 [Micromonospora andamanensis]
MSGLSLAMAACYYDAIADLPDVSPQELHLRIVGWVRRAQPIAETRCMGCVPTILPGIEHDCGGSKIPTEEVRFRCICPEPECLRRQGRKPSAGPAATPRPLRRRR